MFDPRNSGPPESPKHVPPSPVDGFLGELQPGVRERVELPARDPALACERIDLAARRIRRFLIPVADRREVRPVQRLVLLHLVEQAGRRQLDGCDGGDRMIERDHRDVLRIGRPLVVEGVRVHRSVVERGVLRELRVERDPHVADPILLEEDVQWDAVRKTVGETSEPEQTMR
jgi:hypothetical protein